MWQDLIKETEIYQLIVQEGIQQGIEQEARRRVERLQQLILYTCRVRFSDVSALATEKVGGITDISHLSRLLMLLIVTESCEHARLILES